MATRVYANHFYSEQCKTVNERHMREIGWTIIKAPGSNVGENVKELVAWIEANCSDRFIMLRWSLYSDARNMYCSMAFENPRDAMNVKLRWA